jgi:CheY-like chemotaxis protein
MGTETILVAEDEEPVRKIMVRALEKYGYKILAGGNGVEALQKALDYPGKIDLLLTDTIMPQMNGKELADQLKNSRPKIKVVFISGYASEVLSLKGILDSHIHLIQKPFELDVLAREVRKVLDEK